MCYTQSEITHKHTFYISYYHLKTDASWKCSYIKVQYKLEEKN